MNEKTTWVCSHERHEMCKAGVPQCECPCHPRIREALEGMVAAFNTDFGDDSIARTTQECALSVANQVLGWPRTRHVACNVIASEFERGYEQAREQVVGECTKLEAVYLEKERSEVARLHDNTASYFDGKATAAAELGESIAALTPAPSSPDKQVCPECYKPLLYSTEFGYPLWYCVRHGAKADEQKQEAE